VRSATVQQALDAVKGAPRYLSVDPFLAQLQPVLLTSSLLPIRSSRLNPSGNVS
jgi:hypothetical protein